METRGSRTEAALEYIREEKKFFVACSAVYRCKVRVLEKLERKIKSYTRNPEKFRFLETA